MSYSNTITEMPTKYAMVRQCKESDPAHCETRWIYRIRSFNYINTNLTPQPTLNIGDVKIVEAGMAWHALRKGLGGSGGSAPIAASIVLLFLCLGKFRICLGLQTYKESEQRMVRTEYCSRPGHDTKGCPGWHMSGCDSDRDLPDRAGQQTENCVLR